MGARRRPRIIVSVLVSAVVLVQGGWLTPRASAERRDVVIVELEDASAATYDGTIPGLAATRPDVTGAVRLDPASPAVKAYLDYLARKQAIFESEVRAAIADVRVLHRYRLTLNALALEIRDDQVATLARLPGVRAIHRDRPRGLHEGGKQGQLD